MKHHKNFWVASDGDLLRDSDNKVIREKYQWTHSTISNGSELRATLRAGAFAWPGGYPLYLIASDGGAMHFKCVQENLALCIDSMRRDIRDGWAIVGCDVNYEDTDMVCAHCNERIESAYGDEDDG